MGIRHTYNAWIIQWINSPKRMMQWSVRLFQPQWFIASFLRGVYPLKCLGCLYNGLQFLSFALNPQSMSFVCWSFVKFHLVSRCPTRIKLCILCKYQSILCVPLSNSDSEQGNMIIKINSEHVIAWAWIWKKWPLKNMFINWWWIPKGNK